MIPVTILTGFLGSGKSTLVGELIEKYPKTAVVLNEFSNSIEIEKRLVKKTDDVLEFNNGCMCCAVKNPNVMKIEAFLKNRDFERVVIELSGLADPGKIIDMFWLDDLLESKLYIDAVVCLLDGLNYIKSQNSVEWQRQLSLADIVIVTKHPIPDSVITGYNPLATIVQRTELDKILNTNLFKKIDIPRFTHSTANSVCIEAKNIDLKIVEKNLMNISWENEFNGEKMDVWRIKAILTDGIITKVVQVVYDIYESYEIIDLDNKSSKIILIGKKLPSAPIQLFQ